jgi:outer membrane lipoprotein LolB
MRNLWWNLSLLAILVIAGCAYPIRLGGQKGTEIPGWHGRMAVRIHDVVQGAEQQQSFASTFDLKGNPAQGQLLFFTPLGITLASLNWNEHQATLHTPGNTRHFDTLQNLMISVVGADVPLPALFAWLQGTSVPTSGWLVDLSQYANGKILANRVSPEPAVELRIMLDRESSN